MRWMLVVAATLAVAICLVAGVFFLASRQAQHPDPDGVVDGAAGEIEGGEVERFRRIANRGLHCGIGAGGGDVVEFGALCCDAFLFVDFLKI